MSQQVTFLCLLQNPKPTTMLLSGYGVELAIKSTEYKAVDDTAIKGNLLNYIKLTIQIHIKLKQRWTNLFFVDSRTPSTGEADENDEVQGFLFRTLK